MIVLSGQQPPDALHHVRAGFGGAIVGRLLSAAGNCPTLIRGCQAYGGRALWGYCLAIVHNTAGPRLGLPEEKAASGSLDQKSGLNPVDGKTASGMREGKPGRDRDHEEPE